MRKMYTLVFKRKLCFVSCSVDEPVLLNPPPTAMSCAIFVLLCSAALQLSRLLGGVHLAR